MSVLLYDIVIFFYWFIIRVAAFSHPKARLFIRGRKQIFERLLEAIQHRSGPVIWIHCASLGEFEQGRPVMEAIKSTFPEYQILLTFFSPSGYEARKNTSCADHVFYLPIDRRKNALRFLEVVQPECALFVKYELWYHYLQALHEKNIPAVLFSAYFQKNQVFFKSYGTLYRKMLGRFSQIFVQDDHSRDLLLTIGIRRVSIAGDTRFDRAAETAAQKKDYPFADIFKGSDVLVVAGSTWPEDERLLSRVLTQLPDNFRLLIAPHEIREENVQRLQKLFQEDCCLWTDNEDRLRSHRVCIVNAIGHLAFLYRYANIVWMGGGFTRSGIHNLVEPAVYGLPLFFGPNFKRFREAEELIDCGAARSETKVDVLTNAWQQKEALLRQGALSEAYVNSQLGATQKIMDYLQQTVLLPA